MRVQRAEVGITRHCMLPQCRSDARGASDSWRYQALEVSGLSLGYLRHVYLFGVEICGSRHLDAMVKILVTMSRHWCTKYRVASRVVCNLCVRRNRHNPKKKWCVRFRRFLEKAHSFRSDQICGVIPRKMCRRIMVSLHGCVIIDVSTRINEN